MKKLLLLLSVIVMVSCQTKTSESTSADTTAVEKAPEVPYGEEKIEVCTYTDYVLGDCVRIVFSCGEFGAAQRNQLDAESAKLWSELSVEDSNGNEIPNPAYIGKEFEIKYNHIKASSCQDLSEAEKEVEVPNILSFKLVSK